MALITHIYRAIKAYLLWSWSWKAAWAYTTEHDVPAVKPDYDKLLREWDHYITKARGTGINCFDHRPIYFAGEIIYIAWPGAPGALYRWTGSQGYVRCPNAKITESR